jgi:hypothetical protein
MEAILAIVITAILFCFFIRKGKNEISEQTTEDVIDSAYTEAYKLVIKQKKDVNEVDHILESKGLDESQRNSIIVSLLQIKSDKKAKRELRIANAPSDILYGGIWCMCGIVLTCLSLLLSDSIGIGFLFWGAIVYGIQRFVRGLFYKFIRMS